MRECFSTVPTSVSTTRSRESFALVPTREMRDALERDYAAMAGMIFGDVPAFDAVTSAIAKLERAVNEWWARYRSGGCHSAERSTSRAGL